MDRIEQQLAPLADLVSALTPAGQRRLLSRLATLAAAQNRRRIKAQQNPEGDAYVPRRSRREQRGKMFKKLSTAGYLRRRVAQNAARIGYFGGRNAFLARIHQEGGSYTQQHANGQRQRYRMPQRELLGVDDALERAVLAEVIEHLGALGA